MIWIKRLRTAGAPRVDGRRLPGAWLIVALVAANTHAATISWNNPAGGSWAVPANWSSAQVPTSADDVLITLPGNYTVSFTASLSAASLTVGTDGGTGTQILAGTTAVTAPALTIGGSGIYRGSGNVTSAVVRVTGQLVWNGGALAGPTNFSGTTDIGATGTLYLTNNTTRQLARMTIVNAGTIIWGQGHLANSSGADSAIRNNGLIHITNGAPVNWTVTGAGSTNRLENLAAGRMVKAFPGTATLNAGLINQGVVEGQAGILAFAVGGTGLGASQFTTSAGGALQFGGIFDLGHARFSGSGTNLISGASSVVTFGPGATFDPGLYLIDVANGQLEFAVGAPVTIPALRSRGGTLAGSDTIDVTGPFLWNGGAFSELNVRAHGGVFITPSSGVALSFLSGTIENWGHGQWTNGTIQTAVAASSPTLENHDTFDLIEGVAWNDSTVITGARFINFGLVQTPATAQATTLTVAFENRASATLRVTNSVLTLARPSFNEGRVEIIGATGSLHLTSVAQPFEFRAGSAVDGDGQLFLGGQLALAPGVQWTAPNLSARVNSGQWNVGQNSSATVGTLDLIGGFIAGPGTLTARGLTTWQSCDLRTNVTVVCQGGIATAGTSPHSLSAGTLVNAGIGQWTGGNIASSAGPAVIRNAPGGEFHINDGLQWIYNSGGLPNRFVNEGQLIREAGPGTVTLQGDFENSGEVQVNGVLSLGASAGAYHQLAGRTVLAGGTLRAQQGVQLDGGTLDGNGDVDANVVNGGGTIRPGASPGLVHFRRNLVQAPAGTMEIEIGGIDPAQIDRLLVDGTATVGGMVNALYVNGYTPQPGDSFKFLTATAGRSGTFADLTAPLGPPWLALSESPNGAQIDVIPGPPVLSIALPFPATSMTAEQTLDIPVTISYPGVSSAVVQVTAISSAPAIVTASGISFLGTGRVRTMRIHPDVFAAGSVEITVNATGVAGSSASALLQLTVQEAPTQGMIVYEPFAYASGARLSGSAGGSGFSDAWQGSAQFTAAAGTLTAPSSLSAGERAVIGSQTALQTLVRHLATPLGTPLTTRYVSFLARAEGVLGAGSVNGSFGLQLDASVGADLFVGKSGTGDLNHWVVEDLLGVNQAASSAGIAVGQTHWLVLKLEFTAQNDRVSLFIDPVAGQPEPGTPALVRTDRDLGQISALVLRSTGAWSVDELRVGTSWASAVPDVSYLANLRFQSAPRPIAAENTAFHFTPQLQSAVTPRLPVFELMSGPAGMTINAATGELTWTPDELAGDSSASVTIGVHDFPDPPHREDTVTFDVSVKEDNQPPVLDINSAITRLATPGASFQVQLAATDPDIPANTVTFSSPPGRNPAGLTIAPNGLLQWTPDAGRALGPLTLWATVEDFNPQAPAASQRLSTLGSFNVLVVAPQADLAVQGIDLPTQVTQGDSASITFVIANLGPSIATHAQFTFGSPQFVTTPPRLTLESSANDHGSCQLIGDHVSCELGDLQPGASAQVTLQLHFGAVDVYSYGASARSDLPDLNLSNTGVTSVITANERPPDNPSQWQFTHVEDYGETGEGLAMATDRRGRPHAVWFNASTRELHYGYSDGLNWQVRVIQAPFTPRWAMYPYSVRGLSGQSPMSIVVDQNYRVHVAANVISMDDLTSLFYLTLPDGADPETGWSLETVQNDSVSAPQIEVNEGGFTLRRIWFIQDGRLWKSTRGSSATPVWTAEPITLAGLNLLDRGTPLAMVGSAHAFVANLEPDDSVSLYYASLLPPASAQFVDTIAAERTHPIHLSAAMVQHQPTAVYARYHPGSEAGIFQIAQLLASGWELRSTVQAGHLGRPSLTVNSQGDPFVGFCVTEQTADGVPSESEDRYYRRIWYVSPLHDAWYTHPVYRAEELTGGLSLDQKRVRLDHPVDPALQVATDNAGSPMVALQTGWPNENVIFGTLAPRWTLLPPVAAVTPGLDVSPVLALDRTNAIHIGWTDPSETGVQKLNHRQLKSTDVNAYESWPAQAVPGVLHRDGLVQRTLGDFLALLCNPPASREVRPMVGADPAEVWTDQPFPQLLFSAADGAAGPVDFHDSIGSPGAPEAQLAVGFDVVGRPVAMQLPDGGAWVLPPAENRVSPSPARPPLAAAFADSHLSSRPPTAFMAYVVQDQNFRVRVARYSAGLWQADEEVLSLPGAQAPLIDLHWVQHPPFDDSRNQGYLYLAYTLPADQGLTAVWVARRHLVEGGDEPWVSFPLINVAPGYFSELRLQGVRESVRLAAVEPGRVYLASAERSLDTNNVANASVERLPVAGAPRHLDLAMTESRVWLTWLNQDRIELMASGGFNLFSGVELPRSNSELTYGVAELPGNDCACYMMGAAHAAPDQCLPTPSEDDSWIGPTSAGTFTRSNNSILDVLYAVRDRMVFSREGRRLVNLYYATERYARAAANAHPLLYLRTAQTLENFLPALRNWLNGHGSLSVINREMIDQLNSIWDSVAAASEPALRTALLAERARFHDFADFIDRDMDQWATLLQIPGTTPASLKIVRVRSTPAGVAVSVLPVPGRTYTLLRQTTLNSANWSVVANATQVDKGFELILTDPTPPTGSAFYRVESGP